jgi:hypothetical protein
VILLDGIARSGTSLLGRIMAEMLQPLGYHYYYEPMKHPTQAGPMQGWERMIGRVLSPGDEDAELAGYLDRLGAGPAGKVFFKEIRLMLKQDWLLARYPELKIVHLTRDIMGIWSSHCRGDAPDWLEGHRLIWFQALQEWRIRMDCLRAKKVPRLRLLEKLDQYSEAEKYAALWTICEAFAWSLNHPRLRCLEYEDLCVYPLETLRQAAAFLAVPFDERIQQRALAQLRDSSRSVDPSGPGSGLPSASMPTVWRGRLAEADMTRIETIAGDFRNRLGYPPIER